MHAIGAALRFCSGLAKLAGTAAPFRDQQSGAVMAEYGILLSLILFGLLSAILGYTGAVEEKWTKATEVIQEVRKVPNCGEGQKVGNKWC